MKTVRI